MKLISKKYRIKNIAKIYKDAIEESRYGNPVKDIHEIGGIFLNIYNKLNSIEGEITEEKIDGVFKGKQNWTRLYCDECGNWDCEYVVIVGDRYEGDYDMSALGICSECLENAVYLCKNYMKEEKENGR